MIYAIGLDIGTSGVRGCVVDETQALLAMHHADLNGQTPQDWWQALDEVMLALAGQVPEHGTCALALDATSGTVLLVDAHNRPLTPVRMYHHASTWHAAQLKGWLPENSPALSATASLPKVLELAAGLPAHTRWRIAHQADWLLTELSAAVVGDENNQLKLGYDPLHRRWLPELSHWLPETALPPVLPPGTTVAPLLDNWCRRWQLPSDTQVATGTTDSIAAFLATGADRLGDGVISLGSTLAFKLLASQPVVDQASGIYAHRLWDQWLLGGASSAGGAVLVQQLGLSRLLTLSSQLDIRHPSGLDYYPLPDKGERFPINDPDKIPCLSPRPTQDERFLLAMLEGLVRIEQQGWQRLAECSNTRVQRVFAVGGGTRNNAWMGLRQQTFQGWENAPSLHTQACIGSARLALRALGVQGA